MLRILMSLLQNMRLLLLLAAMLVMPPAVPAFAVQPDEILSDAALEARARSLSHGLRCLVCQNQSIDDSDAPLARDLRLLVRERLVAGDSDEQVLQFLVARFGEFVLLKPPVNTSTILLWLAPLVLLAGGTLLAIRAINAPRETPSGQGLTADEERQLRDVIANSPNGDRPPGAKTS